MSITGQFPHARILRFGGSVMNFVDFPTSFIRFLSSYEAVTVPRLQFDGMDFHIPPELDLSRITFKHVFLHEPSDFECMKRLSGISVKKLRILTLETIFPAFQEGWSALTFPGLRYINVAGKLHTIANRAIFVDFLSTHPLVEELELCPDVDGQDSNCFLVEGMYEGYDNSDPFFWLDTVSFRVTTGSSSNAESSHTIKCSKLSLSTGCPTTDAFTSILSRIGRNYPSITSLDIETPLWDPVSIPYSQVSFSLAYNL